MNVLQYLNSVNGNLLLYWRISSGKTNEIVSISFQFSVSKLLVLIPTSGTNAPFLISFQFRRCLKKAIEITECLEAQNMNVLLLGNIFKAQRVVFIFLHWRFNFCIHNFMELSYKRSELV